MSVCIRTCSFIQVSYTFAIIFLFRCKLLSLSIKMKNFIFVTWFYFQILLVQCDIFVNNLNGSGAPIKMCIQKTINHLFSENDTLSLILNSDLCEDAIFEMNTTRPYIVLNIDDINDVELQYEGQFIICPKDVHSLNRAIQSARNNAGRNNRTLGNSKILVITNAIDVSLIFKIFWHYGINNVISLVYRQGISKLFTCDRFAPENKCGRSQKLMIHQDCEKQLSLSFTNMIHQMNKCSIIFVFDKNDMYEDEENHPSALAVVSVIRELSNRINATFERGLVVKDGALEDMLSLTTVIVISWTPFNDRNFYMATEPLVRSDVLWMVPKARQISNMNACVQIFNYDVWIATSVVFICVWLMWFVIISCNGGFTFDKLCLSFLNVWSLTIFGNVARVPRSLALHIILFFYLIYAINMQFAFTSDMSTVLIAPRYEFQIRNLKELADSQLPIYGPDAIKTRYFDQNNTDRKLYTKLQNSMHSVTVDQYDQRLLELHLHGNYAVVTNLEEMRHAEISSNKKVEAYEIRDNSMAGIHKIRLCLFIDHYFLTTLNTFISRMIESGIHDKHKNDFYHQHGYHREKVETMQEDELTLKHLTFIFIFFGFGLCTACVVFCFELVLHKCL
ncbi:hypothetical protein RI129_012974 [Pyrocoelia pectoralis]|uniref:Uncharacterized protein n=1 Tax=Pyrocoelia pectoralis TaxID=417401 RepID=A0AAN7V1U5_9COLE